MALIERFALCARCPAKSSVESWFSGIEALLVQVLGPLGQLRPVARGVIGVAFHARQRRQQDQHIAALFHRHLVLFGALAAAIDLAVGLRIRAQIVRREGEAPAIHARVIHHGLELRLQQARAEEQRERRAGIDHVHRGDAAVAEILLRKVERGAIDIGHQFVRGQRLAIGQHRQFARTSAPPALRRSAISSVSKRLRAFEQRIVLAARAAQQVGGRRAVAPPPGALLALEVFDGVEIVVGQHQVAGDRAWHSPCRARSHRPAPDLRGAPRQARRTRAGGPKRRRRRAPARDRRRKW